MPVPNIRLADKGVRKSNGVLPLISTESGLRNGDRDGATLPNYPNLMVSEDFENYSSGGPYVDGFRWGTAPFGDVETDITDATNLVMNLQFSNTETGGTDAWAELNFEFEQAEHELWIKYRLYIPANYNHPNPAVGGGSTNSKLYFMLESEETSGLSNLIAISGWPSSGGTSMQLNAKLGNTFSTHVGTDSDGRTNIMAIPTSSFGSWQTVVARVFVPPQGVSTGRVTVWIDDAVAADWRDQPLNSTPGATSSGIKKGYFFGFANAGVTEPFDIQIDDVNIGRTAESIGETSKGAPFVPLLAQDYSDAEIGSMPAEGWRYGEVVSSPSYNGTKSASIGTLRAIGDPVGTCGHKNFGKYVNTIDVTEGHTIWQRYRMYIPSTFSWGFAYANTTADDDELTALGCVDEQVDDGNGILKFLVCGPDVSTARSYALIHAPQRRSVAKVSNPSVSAYTEAPGNPIDTNSFDLPEDEWFTIQMAVKVSKTGDGYVRVWVNDQVISEVVNVDTITTNDTCINYYGIGNYWNGTPWSDGAAGRNDFYVSDILVATDVDGYGAPTTVDSFGNPLISDDTTVANF